MAYPKIQRKYRTYEKVSIPDRTIKTGGAKRPTITLGRVAPTPTPGPTLSVVSNDQPARGSTIVMVGGDPNKTYTYVPQSDYQTISYSDTMKKQAQQYSTSKSTGERVAGNIYLGADKAASAYEDFVSPVTKTFDTSVVVDTGNPVKDFLANAGRGFVTTVVKAPSDIVRLSGASGLSVAMLGNANNKQKAEVLSTGLPNFVDAQVDSFKSNPGAFAGGVAAGIVGGKVVGKVAGRVKSGKKTTSSQKKKTTILDSKNKSLKQRVGGVRQQIEKKVRDNTPKVIINAPARKTSKKNSLGLRTAVKVETVKRNVGKKVRDNTPKVIINAPARKTSKKNSLGLRTAVKVETVKRNVGKKVRDNTPKVIINAPARKTSKKNSLGLRTAVKVEIVKRNVGKKVRDNTPKVIINAPARKTSKKNSLGLRTAVKVETVKRNVGKKVRDNTPKMIINAPARKIRGTNTNKNTRQEFTIINGDTLTIRDITGKILFEAPSPDAMQRRKNNPKKSDTTTRRTVGGTTDIDVGNGMMMKTRLNTQQRGKQKAINLTSSNNQNKSSSKKQSSNKTKQKPKKREVIRMLSFGEPMLSETAITFTVQEKIKQNNETNGTSSQTKNKNGTSKGNNTKNDTKAQQKTVSKQKVSSSTKNKVSNAPKVKSKTRTTTAVKPTKKQKPVTKTTEEDKKKQRKKIRKMKEDAFRFETVNTFGWIKDSKPAAKPRKIK